VGIIHYHFITILLQFISLTKLCLLQFVILTIVSICTIVCSLAMYAGSNVGVGMSKRANPARFGPGRF